MSMVSEARFTGQVAIVTGAGNPEGIGMACARKLHQEGATLIIVSSTERIHQRVGELSGLDEPEVVGYAVDLTDAGAVNDVVQDVLAGFERVDVLINNAGIASIATPVNRASFGELSESDWDRDIAVNLKTAFNTTKAVLPTMRANGYGRIVNVSSVTGPLVSATGTAGYSAAKGGMDGMMRALALELGSEGITVNGVAPGWIDTGALSSGQLESAEYTPLRRAGRPDEVAAAVVFLACADASYITGQSLVVDGGNIIQEHKGPGNRS